VEGIKQI